MEYEDEKIAGLKKSRRNQKYRDITADGVYIGDSFVQFHSRKIFERLELYIPESFIEMPEEILLMKYPSVNRPQIVLTSLDCSVNFAFNYIQEKISGDQVEDLAAQMQEMIRKSNPAAVFYKEDSDIISGNRTISMFDYKSYGIDIQLYNLVCFAELSDGILHGVFNCPDKDSEEWSDVAWQALKTSREQMENK